MNLIGNYFDWIDPKWIDIIMSDRGYGRPAEGDKPNSPEMELEYAKARTAGYNENDIYFWMFDKHNVNFELPTPPWIDGKFHWWITKMLPGNFMPLHIDPHTQFEKNSKRYWMPFQDYKPGHIFMYKDTVITNYKAGDVWMYKDAGAIHGSANIGHTPRIVLQISTHE